MTDWQEPIIDDNADDDIDDGADEVADAADGPCRLPRDVQDSLVLQYGPLVRKIARSMSLTLPGVFDFEDAVAVGNIGLVEAVRRYDPTRGASFYVFATHRIRGAMLDAFRSLDRLSRTMRRHVQDADRTLYVLQGQLGRPATDQEAARALGVSLKTYRETLATGRGNPVSLDGLLERDPARIEGIMSSEAGIGDELVARLEKTEMYQLLYRAIRTLPTRDQQILGLYYAERMTMREIAQILRVSETRISQRHAQVLRRLRAILTPIAA